MVDRAEDQFSLAPCVTGVDYLRNVLPAQKRPQHVKLFPLVRRESKPEVLGNDRQVGQLPFGKVFIISRSVSQLCQMTVTPGNEIITAL